MSIKTFAQEIVPEEQSLLRDEHVKTHVSVAALINPGEGSRGLILVEDNEGLLGLPAGRLQCGEHLNEALSREIEEETFLRIDRMAPRLPQDIPVVNPTHLHTSPWYVLPLLDEKNGRTQIGFLYLMEFHGKLPPSWPNPTDSDIRYVHRVSLRNVMQYVSKEILEGGVIRYPRYNISSLLMYISNETWKRKSFLHERYQYAQQWGMALAGKFPGLEVIQYRDVLRGYPVENQMVETWTYFPPGYDEMSHEAEKRSDGYQWGGSVFINE